jgi:hypothetical protein
MLVDAYDLAERERRQAERDTCSQATQEKHATQGVEADQDEAPLSDESDGDQHWKLGAPDPATNSRMLEQAMFTKHSIYNGFDKGLREYFGKYMPHEKINGRAIKVGLPTKVKMLARH